MGYENLDRIEVRFAPQTGSKKPWEIWAHWSDHRGKVFWASYQTEQAARKKAESNWQKLKGTAH